MYIILSIFAVYALGIISYEYNFVFYLFMIVFAVLLYNTIKIKKFIYNIVIFSFLILSFINCRYNSKSVLTQYIDREILITAEIKNMKKSSNADSKYYSFDATIHEINGSELNSKENTIIYIDKTQQVYDNSIIRFHGSVADVNFSKNIMLFNYKNYLRANKIYAVVFCSDNIDVLIKNYSKLNQIPIKFKSYAENLFRSNLNRENADIILSVILGDIDYLDEGFYDNIKVMGLAHIFAVSGSHIVLLYGALISFFKLLGLKRRVRWLITWSLIWFYGFLIGFPLSVLRTLVMFTLLFGSEVLYRRYNSLNSIAMAALILTVINPFWIFDAGFMLSFSAALSLIIFAIYIQKNIKTQNKLLIAAYMFLFLQIFMMPVTAYYFNYVPVMGILYNLILIPVFTVLLIFGFVLLIFNNFFWYIFIVFFKIFDLFITALRMFISCTENFALNGIIIRSFTTCESILFYMFIGFSLYIHKNSMKKCGYIGFAIFISFYIITYVIVPFTDSSMYFNVADAGQGMFSTLSYKNSNFIFDCGSTSNKNMGEYTAVPYITKKGIKNIDGIFISHWDMDHYSGVFDLKNNDYINVKNIYSSEEIDSLKYDIIKINEGDCIKLDNHCSIIILWPYEIIEQDSINNTSLVVLIRYNGRNILLPGDIESEVEELIIGDLNHVDILIVPHHGSITSSSEIFVDILKPEIAVMSYGKNNFKIPSEDVIKRYEKSNSRIFSTFIDGEINFILKRDKLYYNTYVGVKSDNYYELYFECIIPKIFMFFTILFYMLNISSSSA